MTTRSTTTRLTGLFLLAIGLLFTPALAQDPQLHERLDHGRLRGAQLAEPVVPEGLGEAREPRAAPSARVMIV